MLDGMLTQQFWSIIFYILTKTGPFLNEAHNAMKNKIYLLVKKFHKR